MAKQYWILRNDQTAGPFTTRQTRQMAAADMIVASDLISADRINWQRAGQVKGLFHQEQSAGGSETGESEPSVFIGNGQPLPLLLVPESVARTEPHDRRSRHQSPKSGGVICSLLILATIILPWSIGPNGETIPGWKLAKYEDSATVPLLALWVIALVTLNASMYLRGLALMASHAILGLLGAVALTVVVSGFVACASSAFFFLWIVLAALAISTHQQLRIGGDSVLRVFQVVAGALFLMLWVAVGYGYVIRLQDPEFLRVGLLLSATHLACLVGGGFMLIRSRHQREDEKLSRLGLGIVYASVASLVPYCFAGPHAETGRLQLMVAVLLVHSVLPVVYLSCTGVTGFLCGLLRLQNGSAVEGSNRIGGALGCQDRTVRAHEAAVKRPSAITVLAVLNLFCGNLALLVAVFMGPFPPFLEYYGRMSVLCLLPVSGLAYLVGDKWAGYGAGLIYVIMSVYVFAVEAGLVLSADPGATSASVPSNLGISALLLLPYPLIYILITNSRASRRYFSDA